MPGPLDLNTAEAQRDFGARIPDGTFAWVRMSFIRGGKSLPGLPAEDNGLFTPAKKASSDAVMINAAFTILYGPHAKRQVFKNLTVSGGKVDEKGQSIPWNITKQFLRAVIESATGTDPGDESLTAKAKRDVPSFSAMNGIEFGVRIGIEVNSDPSYDDKNEIAHIVTPDEPEWAVLKDRQIPPPRPRLGSRGGARATVAAAAAPAAWQQSSTPAPVHNASPGAAWQHQLPPGTPVTPTRPPTQAAWGTPIPQGGQHQLPPQPQPEEIPQTEQEDGSPEQKPSWLTR